MTRQHPIELFMLPNTLKAKVGGTYGELDVAALRRADSAMDALKSEFNDWTAQDVARLVAAREGFVENANAESQAALLRAAHDIKGQAATFEFPLIARIAASLCKLIQESKTPQAIPIELIDAHVSAVHVIFRDKIADTTNPTALALISELDARVEESLGA